MPKKIHPADEADRAAVARAAYFTAFLRTSPTSHVREEAETLSQAIEAHDRIAEERKAKTGRAARVMIYAVTAEGASVPVFADMIADARAGRLEITGSRAAASAHAVETSSGAVHVAEGPETAAAIEAQEAPPKSLGKRAQIAADAARGIVPAAPDFSAETHRRFRKKLAEVEAMVKVGDIAGLKGFEINVVSSSPKAIAKYRDLAIVALEARRGHPQSS